MPRVQTPPKKANARAWASNTISCVSQALSYDANGNLLSDGTRSYKWDAENRLIAMSYPGQTGKATTIVYDGLGRRTSITSTPAGGGTATSVSYIWCGAVLCQARNPANVIIREYAAEGEYVPGSPGQRIYYGIDQLGSIRRAFIDSATAPAYAYDPYGNPLSAAAPVTDLGYAGMFRNADSGLSLTMFRPYNPSTGRWLSRDPAGEGMDPNGNLYAYVGGNATNLVDPLGLCSPQNTQSRPCPRGYTQYSVSVNATVAAFLGLQAGASIGISVPNAPTLAGTQFFVSGQGSGTLGIGAYAGAGLSAGVGHSSGTISSGGGGFVYGEADVGFGPSLSVSGQASTSGSSVSAGLPIPHIGAGYGAYAGVGAGYGGTLATHPLGCDG